MPSLLAEETPNGSIGNAGFPFHDGSRSSIEKPPLPPKDPPKSVPNGDTVLKRGDLPNGSAGPGMLPNGRVNTFVDNTKGKGNPKGDGAALTSSDPISELGGEVKPVDMADDAGERKGRDDGQFAASENGDTSTSAIFRTTHVKLQAAVNGDNPTQESQLVDSPTNIEPDAAPALPPIHRTSFTYPTPASTQDPSLRIPASSFRVSSPAALPNPQNPPSTGLSSASNVQGPIAGRVTQQRHTLEVPRNSRLSKELTNTSAAAEEVVTATGRFSPNSPARRRGSMTLVRRTTRSINSDMHLDEIPQDEDAARWAELIRQKRASRRKRQEEEDDDRVVVGTKVDQSHVNWVTAYNMLTGIRFTVSRTNAKIDRELTDADFEARHKFSFDITGNELTPSAKYDFKFKDYAPWVFRHLRAIFERDPADYLMSLTSKYILSELTSPGKSGSFFYYSRDYRYIIKTIHHAEHKFLRRILKEYYNHVKQNPNTLLSQFYGLHRVKIPYGRKIHFVVMNNLFPPHRDIHMTFDLKGSTIGRDFREEDLEKNPRATLKDLNWLRRERHVEFGPTKKKAFIEQMEKDVELLQRLKIMDYSMLIGIHDSQKGNQDKIRDKTLKVFQPGGDDAEDPMQTNLLQRTPSKLESARKAKELRQMIKTQKPVPMGETTSKMPEEVEEARKNFYFYSDDGGIRATHMDDSPGEEIYYLGIIDCLTHYGFIKRSEHFFKGLVNPESQISAIPPDRYGERFVRFISGITMSKEEAEKQDTEEAQKRQRSTSIDAQHKTPTDVVMEKAERQAERSIAKGSSEENVPERRINTIRSPSADRGEMGYTLPVVEEAAESGSMGGRSAKSANGDAAESQPGLKPLPTPPKDSGKDWNEPDDRPPTPPKDKYRRNPDGPPTPPKDEKYRRMEEVEMRIGPLR